GRGHGGAPGGGRGGGGKGARAQSLIVGRHPPPSHSPPARVHPGASNDDDPQHAVNQASRRTRWCARLPCARRGDHATARTLLTSSTVRRHALPSNGGVSPELQLVRAVLDDALRLVLGGGAPSGAPRAPPPPGPPGPAPRAHPLM